MVATAWEEIGTPTPRHPGEPPRPQMLGQGRAFYVAVDADGLPSYVARGLVPATGDDVEEGIGRERCDRGILQPFTTPDNTDDLPHGEKPR
jgi:hypothetical protein